MPVQPYIYGEQTKAIADRITDLIFHDEEIRISARKAALNDLSLAETADVSDNDLYWATVSEVIMQGLAQAILQQRRML